MSTTTRRLDTTELEDRVKHMYEEVALEPQREFHFETGRPLAERLGYPAADLDRIPAAAIDSFAGVGYFLDLAAIRIRQPLIEHTHLGRIDYEINNSRRAIINRSGLDGRSDFVIVAERSEDTRLVDVHGDRRRARIDIVTGCRGLRRAPGCDR